MLENPRVRLEPLDASSITDEHVAWLNDPETFRFLGSKFGQTRTSVTEYICANRMAEHDLPDVAPARRRPRR